jgi:hypothetical protein
MISAEETIDSIACDDGAGQKRSLVTQSARRGVPRPSTEQIIVAESILVGRVFEQYLVALLVDVGLLLRCSERLSKHRA